MEEVADSMPLRCGCVISATYVRTCNISDILIVYIEISNGMCY